MTDREKIKAIRKKVEGMMIIYPHHEEYGRGWNNARLKILSEIDTYFPNL